ncbi:MAG: hypothetical protein PHX08_16990 [Lachnospiraceae bacterium]|nr:hypothetical protein [Lachnospiraceae bacterium]
MQMKVKDFLEKCKNTNMKWLIDGEMYEDRNLLSMPTDILEKDICVWCVNQWEGIIAITTE